uniref:NB-ARC domain-containing protein n=1 Tax=Leersia perrieri TaxID=77586 RepID=A0A0D9X6R4_9ORYZ
MGTILWCLSSKCLEKLVQLLQEEVVMTLSVSREIRKVRESLKYFDSVREDADARAIEHRATGIWWGDVKDVMYDIDDILDLLRANWQKQRCCDFCMFSRLAQLPFDHMIAKRIKDVNERLVQIKRNRDMFDSPEMNRLTLQLNGVSKSRCVAASIEELDIVGREIKEATENMVQMIVGHGHHRNISVYGILGMEGIGKTTLAQKIYNDRRIRERFHQVLIWLSVSQSISEIDLLKEAIEKAGGQSNHSKSKDQLLRALLDSVSGKSVFLVLDNMMTSDIWIDLLRSPMERTVNAYMSLLPQEVVTSYRKEDEINVFSDIGLQIVRKCDGLPLAIKALAGVLSSKTTKEEWVSILESNWRLEGLPNEIQGSLYLSYNDLSPQLKSCFVWCALLPQNFNIYRDVTYWWIAEGFVKKEGNRPIQDVAEDYYLELIRRNLLQARPEYIDKGISTMHDLLRLLGQYLTRDEALFMNKENDERPTNHRGLAIGNAVEEIPGLEKQKRLRPLVLVGAGLQIVPESVGYLVLLRLLDVSYNEIKKLPESIGNLPSLECLSVFGCTKLVSLPASFMKLTKISFLQIGDTGLAQIPKGIGNFQQMDNLRSVFQNGTTGFEMDELGTLSKIRRLRVIKLEQATPPAAPVLCNKNHLKELGLCCTMEPVRRTQYQDSEMKKIEMIYSILHPPPSLIYIFLDGFPCGTFPEWLSSEPQDTLPNLAHMHFNHCISCPKLPPAGQLPVLQVLHVKGADAVVSIDNDLLGKGIVFPTHITVFPKLELLEIFDMYNWQTWSLGTESLSEGITATTSRPVYLMPCLKRLLLINCPKLRNLPEDLHRIVNLRRVHIEGAHSLQEIIHHPGVEWLKVKNNRNLRRISNLCKLHLLLAQDCPQLQQAEDLSSLKILYMVDCPMEKTFWMCFSKEQQRVLTHVITTGAYGQDIYPLESAFS